MANRTQQGRMAWLDVAKGIGITLTIIGHTLVATDLSRRVIYSFHMPLFFVIAGYTFRKKAMGECARSSARQLLVPYTLVLLARDLSSIARQKAFGAGSLARHVLSFLFASGTEIKSWGIAGVGPVWFLVALFLARIMANLVETVADAHGVSERVKTLVYVLLACLGIFIGSVMRVFLPLSFDVALVALVFVRAGMLMRHHRVLERFRSWQVMGAALVVWGLAVVFGHVSMASRLYPLAPLAVSGAICGSYLTFLLSQAISSRAKTLTTALVWLGQNSLLLLCIHTLDVRIAPWRELPLTATRAHARLINGVLRWIYCVLVTLVCRLTMPKPKQATGE